jgi:hypothetical protein
MRPNGRTVVQVALAVAIVLVAGACASFPSLGGPTGGPYPEACAQWSYSARRCDAIVDRAATEASVPDPEIRAVRLLPFERGPGSVGHGQVALVQFELVDGTTIDQGVWCVGVDMSRTCNESAEISVGGGVDHDVPCAGEPPEGCATLPPTPDPDAVAAAKPLRIDTLDVPLDHEGPYEVRLGTAMLPNGYLSELAIDIADRSPDTFWMESAGLQVRPDIPGRPQVGSIYRDPFDGPEPVTVFLIFDLTSLDSPSVLQVRDIVVR